MVEFDKDKVRIAYFLKIELDSWEIQFLPLESVRSNF
jgi:hypothetical protein